MQVINDGDTSVELIAVRTTVAREVQIHEMKMTENQTKNAMAGMRQHESVTIAPHATVTFAPGGLHLMLIDLTRPLKEGERIAVTLQFKSNTVLSVPFTVRSVLHETATTEPPAR